MLSKEEKMQYGQLLRQQIKQKEEAKKSQKRQYTPQEQNMPTQINPSYQPPPKPKTPNIKPEQLKNPREQQKELLAKKMESVEYNPFGRGGGGAPVLQQPSIGNRQRSYSNQNNTENMQMRRNSSFEKGRNSQHQQNYQQQIGRYGMPAQGDPYRMPPGMVNQMQGNPTNANVQYKRIPTPEFLQGAYNNAPFISADYAPPAPYGYVAQDNEINYLGKIDLPPQSRLPYQPRYEPQYQPSMVARPPMQDPMKHHEILDNYNNRQHEIKKEDHFPTNQNSNNLNEQDMFKKGGRNLLKFENQEPSSYQTEQQKKLKLQQELKMQIEEANRRKKEEQNRRKEQDQRLERKNLQFLAQEKRKYQEQLKGKQVQAKGVADANAHKNSQPVNLKKQKFQKIREAVAQRQEQQRRQAMNKQTPIKQQKEMRHTPRVPLPPKQSHHDFDEIGSVISSDTQLSRGFNTAISKEFFRKERQKNKIEKFSEQMHKMRKEIAHQGEHYHDEIDKLQREADRAKKQKDEADQQIIRLKKQLRRKMDVNNKKYIEQIYNGKVKINDPYYADEVRLEQKDNRSLKPRNSQKLILEEYQPQGYSHPEEEQTELGNNSDMMTMMSLVGDSKKIPLELEETNTAMSISKLGDFAKDTDYFKMNKPPRSPSPQRYHPQNSIEEQDQRAEQSRHSRRPKKPKDELDNLLKSRSQSRGGWGEMSSVNQDLVVEIDKMLNNKQRPKSHMSSMGEKTLFSNENEKRSKAKNEQFMMKRKLESFGEAEAGDGPMNSLDKLIQKYL